ncbi:MAG: hypothetical protein E7409_02280 [Ruminococcaceae bacterium]|nr:hypothetical protein [Oscillospiraceae bacterium]
MNWEKLKTFLIFLFLGINIFLIATNLHSFYTESIISRETVSDTVSLLAQKGISVEPDIIPRSVESLENIILTNILFENDQITRAQTGEQFAHPMDWGEVTENSAKDEAKRAAKRMGLEYAQAFSPRKTEGGIVVELGQQIRGITVFDSVAQAVFANGTATLSGTWYVPEVLPRKASADDSEKVYITGVLIDFIGNPDRAAQTQITGIDFGYRIPTYESGMSHKQVTAVPCYRLTTADGNRYDYNAKTGEYIR